MDKITWKKSKIDGRIGIGVPYNAVFNEQFKAAVPSAKFDRTSDTWFLDEEAKDEVIPLLEKFYLSTTRQRVTWNIRSVNNITIDGARLLFVNRDYYKFSHGHGLEFKIVENELSAGGSRNHPCVSGKLVLEISLRDGAVIEPAPDEIVPVVEDHTAVPANLLEAYPTSSLVAELDRRGQASETPALTAVSAFLSAFEAQDRYAIEKAVEAMRRVVEFA